MDGEEREKGEREGGRGRERDERRNGTCMYACGMLLEAVICCTCLYTEKNLQRPPSCYCTHDIVLVVLMYYVYNTITVEPLYDIYYIRRLSVKQYT